MNKCPFDKKFPLRSDLPPLTDRLAALPVDELGYPVPFFVSWIDGKPEFRVADGKKWKLCVTQNLCCVCGQPLGAHKAFAIGPMCSINRTTAEPPAHYECAEWAVRGCPFLSKPKMVRRENGLEDLKEASPPAGISIDRNPGVTCIWTTKKYSLFTVDNGYLIRLGEPERVEWYREGRIATRLEVLESITTGLPKLKELCDTKADFLELERHMTIAFNFLPVN